MNGQINTLRSYAYVSPHPARLALRLRSGLKILSLFHPPKAFLGEGRIEGWFEPAYAEASAARLDVTPKLCPKVTTSGRLAVNVLT